MSGFVSELSVRDGKFDVAIVAGPRVTQWPSPCLRALSLLCTEMGLTTGTFGGESLTVRGVIPLPGTGGLVTGLPAFFSFLPMVFFFMALFLNEIRKELAAILARLDQLGTETQRGREQRG